MRISFLLCGALLFAVFATYAKSRVIAGPMPGYSTMSEVGLWLQLNDEAGVVIEYWEQGHADAPQRTPAVTAQRENAFVARFAIGDLEPGKTYGYKVLLNDEVQDFGQGLEFKTQPFWQFRTDPPAFKLALGSCAYINEEGYDRPGKPYGSAYEIFDAVADQSPDLMLWLGDNIYLRERDLQAWSGYLHRYTHTRSLPEMQRLLRSTHHYAIWDDHDFGSNDANGSWIHKDWALKGFELFWMNPSAGIPGVPGITTAFQYGDVDFFLLDNRYNRTAQGLKEGEACILGKIQVDWLIQALKYSRAPFKLVAVGGQVLNTARVFENHAQYADERAYLLQRIAEEEIRGVVFLTGDRHHTELSRYVAENGIVMYDLTVSPLTSGTHHPGNERNELNEENTLVTKHNFGIIEFTGPEKSRQMNISIFDQAGKIIWGKTLEFQ